MPVLKSLNFTTLPQVGANPVIDRRSRVIERLEEQKRLLADPNHKRTIRSTVKKDGQKTTVEKQHRILPWWRLAPNGSYVFFIKASQKAVEFEKGKAAIAVPSLDKLPALIDTLIGAVRAGELDDPAVAGREASAVRKIKKAA